PHYLRLSAALQIQNEPLQIKLTIRSGSEIHVAVVTIHSPSTPMGKTGQRYCLPPLCGFLFCLYGCE
ncbi:MAG: hypothetical protein K2G28_01520, partial [Acetatifactor sp.]|nr:hypothetical protein [Acetatifactor sp.]